MKPKAPRTPPRAKIRTISVSRLYNTGNYTNVKYELTAEVPNGVKASETLRQLTHTLHLLRPLPIPHCRSQYLEAMAKPQSDLSEYQKENYSEWKAQVEQFEKEQQARNVAVDMLDQLGGASVTADHKRNWEDDTPF